MPSWWHRDVLAAGKLPLMKLPLILCFLAFVVIILLLIGAFTAVGGPDSLGWRSFWARHRYRGERLQRATRRAADFDRRWAPLQTGWEDFVGGKPSQPNPPAGRLGRSDEVDGGWFAAAAVCKWPIDRDVSRQSLDGAPCHEIIKVYRRL